MGRHTNEDDGDIVETLLDSDIFSVLNVQEPRDVVSMKCSMRTRVI